MSYQVLARKWRPRTFHELVGQEHVQRALVNALDQGRLHHAYLFTGTRGVGKTTLARILAKCLNCEQGVTSSPCGVCTTCRDIDEGRFVDLIEVDAASRTKVEDTRELLDNVQYAPTQGRYKVYLIDEVHMLSTHSFNALLKTLEEPPPHVKFLLATTDPQKLPVTVLSRCLQFSLKNMPPERIVDHLQRVLEAESVSYEEPALWLLGKAAQGSMRDAMSLTDQAIAFGQGAVRHADVSAMLGTLDHRHLLALVEALAEVDAARALAEVASLAEQGPDFAGVLDDLTGILHRLAIAQMVPEALDNGHGDRDTLLALAARFTAEDVQLYYQIGLQGRGDLEHAPDPRTALEMTLLRMLAFRPQGVPKPPQTPLPLRGERSGSDTPPAPSDAPPPSGGVEPAPAAEAVADEPAPDVAPEVLDAPPAAPLSPASTNGGEGAADPAAPSESRYAPPAEPEPEAHTGSPAFPDAGAGPDVDEAPPPWDVPPDALVEARDHASDVSEAGVAMDEAPVTHASAVPAPPSDESEPEVAMRPEAPLDAETGHAESAGAEANAGVSAGAEAALSPGEALTQADWLALFPRLGLAGLTRNLAAHCLVDGDDGGQLTLRLDPGQAAMLAEVHIERVRQALAAAGVERRVVIEPGELPPGVETPKARSDREARERHAEAVEALRHDPHIQELEQAFGARLIEQSVSPQSASD
ncbi:DNA polymerase III subunit gamma/tau [Modicisalibacter coralii]|uniref:DNA polymerase III subunit gamma/tau n=1 Tax=Modicisalibacter coralii TaxID=2304602 RepID=UPI00100B3F2F|nr:DNA polymerase III subunit gamma/tau [Halomonas coralii]